MDADGWPPAESEGLWAEALAGGGYRLDNTSWLVRGVAVDDVIDAQPDADGVLWFLRVRERRGRVVVRVLPRRDGPLSGDRQALIEAFAALGISGEGMARPVNMVALDIGPEACLTDAKGLLVSGEEDGRWSYEEGCVTTGWQQIS